MAQFQQDPPRQREQVLSTHDGFINRNVPWILGENQVQATTNLIINTIGARTRRGGARAFGGISGGVVNDPGGFVGYNDANFTELIAGVWGNNLYSSTGNGGWDQIASGESMVSGLLHDFTFVDQGGNLALAVGSAEEVTNITEASPLFVYDIENDASTTVSLAFGPRCIASFQNRLWAGIDQTLYWSNIIEPAHMSEGNTILVEPGLGGQLTAIVPARDRSPRLWLFKDDAVLVFEPKWGSSSALIPSAGDALDVIGSSLRVLTQGAGCVATRSAVWVPGEEAADLFFLARDGVRSLRRAENDVQAGAGFPLTYDISDTVNRINWAAAHRAAAVVHDNAYHLAVPLDGALENTHVLRFDIATRAWSLLEGWGPKEVRTLSLGGQSRFFFQSTLAAGDTSSTGSDTSVSGPFQVYQGLTGEVDPSEAHITLGEDSRSFIFGELATKKRWDEVRLQLSSTETATYNLFYRVDFGPWTTLVSEAILPGDGQSVLLANDALAWNFGQDEIRTRSYGLQDVADGYQLQLRLTGSTDATDTGRISVYNMQVFAWVDEQLFEVEN